VRLAFFSRLQGSRSGLVHFGAGLVPLDRRPTFDEVFGVEFLLHRRALALKSFIPASVSTHSTIQAAVPETDCLRVPTGTREGYPPRFALRARNLILTSWRLDTTTFAARYMLARYLGPSQ
jgi:hypothetical protein